MGDERGSLQRPTRWRYLVLFFLCVLSFLTYYDRACINRAQKAIQHDLNLDDYQMGWVFSVFFIAYALFEIPGGWLGDRYGTRGTLIRIVLAWSLFTMMSGCATGFWTLFTCRLMFGAGEAGAYPNMARAQRQWLPVATRARAGGLLWLTARFGAAFTPFIYEGLVEWFGSPGFTDLFRQVPFLGEPPSPWRMAFLCAGVMGVVWCVAFYPWFRDDPRDATFVNDAERRLIRAGDAPHAPGHSMPGAVWKSLLLSRSLWAIGLMYVATSFAWSFYITWLPRFLQDELQLEFAQSRWESGLPFFFGGCSCLVGGVCSDFVVRWTGRKWLGRALFPVCGYACAALCMFALPFARTKEEVAILLCVANACSDFGQGANWAAIVDMGGRYAGTAAGFINMIGNAGPSIQSVVGPMIFNAFGWPALFGVYACTYLLAASMWFLIDPTRTFYRDSDLPANPHPETQPMSDPAFIFDVHLDLSMNALEWNRDLRWSLERIRRWELTMKDKVDRGINTVCFPEMRRGRIGLCVATQIGRYSPYFHRLPGWNSPEQAWAQTQGQLAWYRVMEEAGELVQVRNREQLDKHLDVWMKTPLDTTTPYVIESRRKFSTLPIGYILSLEGADSIVSLKHLERSYADGLARLGPAHYGPGRYAHGTDANGPLPAEGKDLLKEMQRLGIILDVTHLCDECFWDALDVYQGPLWASHQNCRVLAPWNRQFADDQIKAVIERGGVLGMAFDAIMMVPGWRHHKSKPGEFQLKIERICDHIDHICQLAGNAKHVGIGTDLDGGYGTDQTPMDLDSIADLQTLPGLLKKRGYSAQDVEGIMWRNFVEFLRRVWK